MDPVTVFALLAFVGMNYHIDQQEQRIDHLQAQTELQQKWIEDLEVWNKDQDVAVDQNNQTILKQAAAHSSLYANQKMTNEDMKKAIDNIIRELQNQRERSDYIDEKVNILHP